MVDFQTLNLPVPAKLEANQSAYFYYYECKTVLHCTCYLILARRDCNREMIGK